MLSRDEIEVLEQLASHHYQVTAEAKKILEKISRQSKLLLPTFTIPNNLTSYLPARPLSARFFS